METPSKESELIDKYKETQNEIVEKAVNLCVNKEISDEVVKRLERKWGKPKIETVNIKGGGTWFVKFKDGGSCAGWC